MLASHRVGINLHNDNGDTPLLLAARTSQPKLARILLEKGELTFIICQTALGFVLALMFFFNLT